MDYKMVNILTLLLGCACVSAQPGARPPAGPPTSRPAGPPTRPPAGPLTRPPAGPPTRPPAGPSTRPPASTAPPNDDVSPVPVVLSTDMLCIQSLIDESGLQVEALNYTEGEEASIIEAADSVDGGIPDDADVFSDLGDSVAQAASARTSSAAVYHVGYFWRNPCNPRRFFGPISSAETIDGQKVAVLFPRRFYQVRCRPYQFCRCYGKCIQEYCWQWAWVARGCRYYWALIKVPCSCCCHRYFPYYYHD